MSDGYYFTGSGWQNAEPANLPQCYLGTSSFTYTFANNSYWTNNTSYTITSKAFDNAGNSGYGASSYFIYDVSAPSATVTLPANDGVTMTSLSTISGTAQDWGIGQVSQVNVRIQRVTVGGSVAGDSDWWTGSAWQSGSFNNAWWLPASWNSGTGVWQFPTAGIGFTYNGGYRVDINAEDMANNYQMAYSSRTFIFQPPMANTVISSPLDSNFYNTLNLINGTSNGQTTVLNVSIQRVADGQFYNASASSWTVAPAGFWFNITPSSPTWNFTVPGSLWVYGSSYTVRRRREHVGRMGK